VIIESIGEPVPQILEIWTVPLGSRNRLFHLLIPLFTEGLVATSGWPVLLC
jgi:hypothetical protein